jgi:ABC-type sugar transport system substrate-binding protein/AraC-like DNA-binding protein
MFFGGSGMFIDSTDFISNKSSTFEDKNIHTKFIGVVGEKQDFTQFIEIQYVKKGCIIEKINNDKIAIDSNSICFLNKNVFRKVVHVTEDAEVYRIFIHNSFLNNKLFDLLSEDNIFYYYFHKSLFIDIEFNEYIIISNINQQVKNIITFIINQDVNEKNEITAYLSILLNKLNTFKKDIDRNKYKLKKNKEVLKKILEYINNNYNNASLKVMSDELHLHKNYICKIIKEATGKTFVELVNEIRFKVAKQMLETTDKSIETISEEIGYNNPNYFYKLFKSIYGITPGKYRQKTNMTNNAFIQNIDNNKPKRILVKENDDSFVFRNFNRQSNKKLSVVYMPAGIEYKYTMTVGKAMLQVAEKAGINLTTFAPQSGLDINTQMQMLHSVINNDVDAIILNTHDELAAVPLIKKAIQKGIIICIVNRDCNNFPIPVHAIVGYKQRESAYGIGRYVVEKMKNKKVNLGIIKGYPCYHSAERCAGFIDAIANENNFEIKSILNGYWNEKGGYDAAMSMLQEHPQINVIFTANDQEADGAIKAIKRLKKTDITLVSNDGTVAGLKNVASGKITATISTTPLVMGETAINIVIDTLKGKLRGGNIETLTQIVDKSNVFNII